ncbi:MAG: hypothetical protein HZB50_10400 [Chloroflexi bacterium]|nr:hypothetical protein [Chloroflexota bacterium]
MKSYRAISYIMLALSIVLSSCNLPARIAPPVIPTVPLAVFTAIPTEPALATIPPIPTETITAAFTATPTQVPPTVQSGTFFIVDVAANCRSGPGKVYPVLNAYPIGQSLKIIGRNADNSWWKVEMNASQSCWVSNILGHITGDIGIVPIVLAPPTPAIDVTAPALSGPISLSGDLSYPTAGCGSTSYQVAIRVAEEDGGSGIDSVWIRYRYQGDSGYVGSWHTATANDNAMGGINGFNYSIVVEASAELVTDNGVFEYQFHARDKAGNTSYYPDGSLLGIPVHYCP